MLTFQCSAWFYIFDLNLEVTEKFQANKAVLATVRYPHWKSLCHSPMEISGNPHRKFLSNESVQGDHRSLICTCSVFPEWNLLLYSLLWDSSFLNSIWFGHPVWNNIDFQEFTLLGVWKSRWNTVSRVWYNISNARNSVSLGFPNTENRVENMTRSGVFWTKFKVFR